MYKLEDMKQLIEKIILKTDDVHYPYKPRLVQVLSDKACIYAIEKNIGPSPNNWFRILRIKNGARLHDFIINDFRNNTVLIENDKSQVAELKFTSKEELKELFLAVADNANFFRSYSRPKNNTYSVDESKKMNKEEIAELFN